MLTKPAASILFVLLGGACASGTVTPEESVRPGVNQRYLADDVDVDHWVGVFEGESREIAVHREAILAALGIGAGADVADIGAGTGLFVGLLDRAVGPEGSVFAVDLAPAFVEHLEARRSEEGWRNVRIVLSDATSVRLPPRSIDLAFVCDVYHHFEYPRSTLTSLLRALRPGGRLVIVDFERIPGVTRPFLLDHVRADKQTFTAEIEAAGFTLERELEVPGLEENYVLVFRRP